MAKARAHPRIAGNALLKSAAAAAMLAQSEALETALFRVCRKGSPSSVHDARAALRRLNALALAFSSQVQFPKLGRKFRALFKRLGKVRDADVSAKLLGKRATKAIFKRRKRAFAKAKKRARKMLRQARLQTFRMGLAERLAHDFEPSDRRTLQSSRDALLSQSGRGIQRAIQDHLKKQSPDTFHALRIALKRRKDVTDIIGSTFKGEKQLGEWTALLGDLHDAYMTEDMSKGKGRRMISAFRKRLEDEARQTFSADALHKLGTALASHSRYQM